MKTMSLLLSLYFILASQSACADLRIPNYEKFVLKNGLTVYLMEQHEVPLVDIRMTTKAGAIYDGQDYGIANLTTKVLGFGSQKLAKNKFEDLLAFHGAIFSSYAETSSSHSTLSIAVKDLELFLPVFSDVIATPNFQQSNFKKMKKRYIENLKQAREKPKNIVRSLFNKMYYQNHPYGNPVTGSINTVKTISLKQVEKFHKTYYAPNNSALFLVGDFQSKDVLNKIKKHFSQWKPIPVAEIDIEDVIPPNKAKVWLINKDDALETLFMIGGASIHSAHPESISVKIINTLLGGKFTSWLNEELRINSGLTYGAHSFINSHPKSGTFAISTFTNNKTTFEAIDLALKTYRKIWREDITREMLEGGKSYIKGQFPTRYETSSQLSQLLSHMWSLNLTDSFINDFQKNVDSLTPEKANRIARSLFPKNNLQFILIGKASELREKAKKYGQVTEMDINNFSF